MMQLIERLFIGASWRTSIAGWVCLIAAIATGAKALLDGDPSTSPSIEAIVAAAAGVGLISARDNTVTSKAAGAR